MRALLCLTLFAFVLASAEMCFFAPNGSTICSLADVCSHREKVPEDKRVYTTVASENYFLGAVVLAQSLLDVNAKADIVIAVPIVNNSAVDAWIPHAKELVASMKNNRVSVRTYYANPIPDFLPEKTKKNPKTVYWYGKLNLWGVLHDYKKAQFIDSDAVAMDNMDLFFEFPELTFSACPRTPINSGWFVFKPSMKTMNEMVGMEFEGNFSAVNGWRGVGPHFPWTAAKPYSLTDNRKNRQNLKTSCFIRELKDKAGCSWEWGPTEQGIIYHQFYYEKKSVCPFPFPPSNGKDVPYYYHYNDVFCQSLATSDLKPWQITPDHKCWPKAFDPWQVAFEHLAASVGSTTTKLRAMWVK